MKRRRLKKSVIRNFFIIIILIICLSIFIKISKYHKTNEYKLKQIGYKKEEIALIIKEPKENIDYVLASNYNDSIDDIINEKYYLNKNLQKYIEYKNNNQNTNLSDIIAIINTHADKEEYRYK